VQQQWHVEQVNWWVFSFGKRVYGLILILTQKMMVCHDHATDASLTRNIFNECCDTCNGDCVVLFPSKKPMANPIIMANKSEMTMPTC